MTPKATGIDPLRNYDEWVASVRNFHGWLGKTVAGGTDVDLMVERNGEFLVIEAKPWTNGVTLPYGQHLALNRLSDVPVFTVYLVGEAEDCAYIMPYTPSGRPVFTKSRAAWWPPKSFVRTSRDGMREIVEEWWAEAA